MVIVLTSGKLLTIHLWLVALILCGSLYGLVKMAIAVIHFIHVEATAYKPLDLNEPRLTAAEWAARERDRPPVE